MARDIVCAEAELSIAANNLVEYADFLSRTIESYIDVLYKIQTRGIRDDLVCSELSSIAQMIEPCKAEIKEVCDEISADVREYIVGIARADNFTFPGEITSKIISLVTQFL